MLGCLGRGDSRGGCFGEPLRVEFSFLLRLRRTTRGVAAFASPRVPSYFFAAIAEDDSRGGCFGEPPSAELLFFAAVAEDDSRGGCFGEPPSAKLSGRNISLEYSSYCLLQRLKEKEGFR